MADFLQSIPRTPTGASLFPGLTGTNRVAYVDSSGILRTEAGFEYDDSANTLGVDNINAITLATTGGITNTANASGISSLNTVASGTADILSYSSGSIGDVARLRVRTNDSHWQILAQQGTANTLAINLVGVGNKLTVDTTGIILAGTITSNGTGTNTFQGDTILASGKRFGLLESTNNNSWWLKNDVNVLKLNYNSDTPVITTTSIGTITLGAGSTGTNTAITNIDAGSGSGGFAQLGFLRNSSTKALMGVAGANGHFIVGTVPNDFAITSIQKVMLSADSGVTAGIVLDSSSNTAFAGNILSSGVLDTTPAIKFAAGIQSYMGGLSSALVNSVGTAYLASTNNIAFITGQSAGYGNPTTNAQLIVANVTNAVNAVNIQGSIASGQAAIYVTGTDTNTGIGLLSKGTGVNSIGSLTNGTVAQFTPVASGSNYFTFTNSNGGNPTLGVNSGNIAVQSGVNMILAGNTTFQSSDGTVITFSGYVPGNGNGYWGTYTNHPVNIQINNSPVATFAATTGDLSLLGVLAVNGQNTTIIANAPNSGSTNSIISGNNSNTAGSDAQLNARVAGASGGDPYLSLLVTGVSIYTIGIDNSDSDKLKIDTNSVGTATLMELTTAGAFRWNAYGAGTITSDASGNLTAVSDTLLKSNVFPFTQGLDVILGINPIQHGYSLASGLDQTKKDYVGFDAFNVKQVLPQAVGVMQMESGKLGIPTLTLNPFAILAANVNATKELYEELQAIKQFIGMPTSPTLH